MVSVGFGKCDWRALHGRLLFHLCATRDGISNREGLAQVKRTVEACGGKWHSHRKDQGLEDAAANSVVIVEFGSMTQAESCYNPSEYKNVLDLYVENAIDLVLADGVSPDFTMAGFAQERPLSTTFQSVVPVHERRARIRMAGIAPTIAPGIVECS